MTTTNPVVMFGKPCFAGTRIPVESVTVRLRGGMTVEQVQEHYPQLSREQIESVKGK